jgi:spore coat polysaccharide biosynthesis protein SpsF
MTDISSEPKRTVAIIQARMSASRLPGKVLHDIGGKPMLARVVDRTRRAQLLDQVVVATSTDQSDDPIEDFCLQLNYPFFRGSLHDVLDRYYNAAVHFSAGNIMRITGDCPIIDPILIDQTLLAYFGKGPNLITRDQDNLKHKHIPSDGFSPAWDFAANRLPPPWKRTFPIGLDTEVCRFSALEAAWKDAKQSYQREHVMPYLYEDDHGFQVLILNHQPDYGELRLTVDTPQDLELLNSIYGHFGTKEDFSWYDVLDLLRENPKLLEINAEIDHKDYRDFETTHRK